MSDLRTRLLGFFTDLRRRRVFRVAAGYLVMSWVAIEVSSTTFPLAGLPAWTPTLVLVLTVLGFPLALVLAWAYDITPEGVRRSDSPGSVEQWRRAQGILGTALELPEGERGPYIQRTTSGDAALREDVVSLLRAHGRAGPLDRPPGEWAEPLLAGAVRSAPAEGRTVRHYDILEKLGGGGMGVVFRARDRRLERTVALKFLPPHLSHDPEAKQRFMVEAQAAAALDHPHICTLFEIGQTDDGQLFLAMPCYDGETLKRRLSRGPLPLAEAVDLASQAASGLAAAHARGIVHRDIKPANLIVTRDGVLKIVDFGIAKLSDVSVTTPGLTPGTVAYMSPEQARGEAVDARSDVWSLGVVLYEALAGRRPFVGPSDEVVLQAIRRVDPEPVGALRPEVPPAVEAIVRRALARDPAARYESGAALQDALAGLLRQDGTGVGDDRSTGAGSTAGGELTADGERRQATLVVATVGGFGALVEECAPDEVRTVVARIRAASEDVATRFGGVVNGFEDERIELLFGVPVSHEDHCFRAVRAALELHERVRSIEAPSGGERRLTLQTGVDTGQVVAQRVADGARLRLVGTPTRTAARLQAHAASDELWITPACQRMVGPFFDTEPGEPRSLGADAVVTPHRVRRLSGLRTRIEAGRRVGLTRYVGRGEELARLGEALDGARSGRGHVVGILGEAGVGKSRLVHEFRSAHEGPDILFLEGRCQSYGGTVAYLPFLEVLRGALGLEDTEPVDRAAAVVEGIGAIGEELEELVPLYLHLLSLSHPDHPLPTQLQGESLRHAIQEALAGVVTLLTRRGPVVLLLEDLHWADDASGAVLRQIAEVAPGHALLVVTTARPGASSGGEPARQTTLALEPLGMEASADMLRTVLGTAELPERLAEHVHSRTGGNPFFIEEVGRTLLEEGAVRVHGGVATLVGSLEGLQLPNTVEAVIRARLDRLDRDTREVVRVASVIGREFARRLLEQAMEGGSRLPHAIQTLKTSGLIQQIRVVPDAVYRFNHVLTQVVAYGSLLERQRVELHGHVAEAIERLHADRLEEHYERLADHYGRAGSWAKAVHYGLGAAERIGGLSAFAEALQQLERCEEWIGRMEGGESTRLLVDVLLRQERLCETLGLRARQQELIDRLIALLEGTDDRESLAEAYLRQGDLFTLLRRFSDAERVLFESLRLRREGGDPDAIRNSLRSLGLLRWHEDRQDEAIPFIEETLAIDRRKGDVDALVGDLSNMGAVLKSMGELTRARAALDEALELVEGERADGSRVRGSLLKECYILHNLANVHRELGENGVAMRHLERAKRLVERERLPIQLSYHFTSIAHLCLQQGRLEEALAYYRQAVEMGRKARYTPGLSQALRMLGEVLLGLGREAEALPHLAEAAGLFAQLEDAGAEAGLWRDAARARERLGEAGDALAAWRRAADLYRGLGDAEAEVEAMEGVARASRRAGLPAPEIRDAYLHALARAEAIGATAARARLLNGLGIMAWEARDHAEALRRYGDALAIFRQLGDPGGTGLMLNSIAVTLKTMGRRDEARRRLEEALPVHRGSGNKVLEGHAFAALGDLALESGEGDRALWLFTESLALREEVADRVGEGWMHSRIASAQLARGKSDLATKHMAAARAIAEECGDRELAGACERLPLATTPH